MCAVYPPNITAYVSVSDIAGRTRHTRLPESRRGMAMDWLRRAHLLGKSNECETKIVSNGGENISAYVIPSGFRIPKYHFFESRGCEWYADTVEVSKMARHSSRGFQWRPPNAGPPSVGGVCYKFRTPQNWQLEGSLGSSEFSAQSVRALIWMNCY